VEPRGARIFLECRLDRRDSYSRAMARRHPEIAPNQSSPYSLAKRDDIRRLDRPAIEDAIRHKYTLVALLALLGSTAKAYDRPSRNHRDLPHPTLDVGVILEEMGFYPHALHAHDIHGLDDPVGGMLSRLHQQIVPETGARDRLGRVGQEPPQGRVGKRCSDEHHAAPAIIIFEQAPYLAAIAFRKIELLFQENDVPFQIVCVFSVLEVPVHLDDEGAMGKVLEQTCVIAHDTVGKIALQYSRFEQLVIVGGPDAGRTRSHHCVMIGIRPVSLARLEAVLEAAVDIL